jgi:intracellular sulfur oxidation DsrE/DsrF family protein
MDSYNGQNVRDAEVTPVVVFRHMGMPLALRDAVWEKYKLGEFLKVNDPKTNAPATRNVFRESIAGHPGLTYEALIKRGAVIVACNVALNVLSGMTAQQAGVPADEAKKEWTANLIPGVALAPSGVYAVNRAQERGCAYCYAG